MGKARASDDGAARTPQPKLDKNWRSSACEAILM